MIRLRNVDTGVQVNVDEETASRLPGRWEPVEPAAGGAASASPVPVGARPKNRKQWVALAAELGVEIPDKATVAVIKDAIAAHEATATPARSGDDAAGEPPPGEPGVPSGQPEGAIW